MNKIFLIGNLTRDVDSRTTQSGKQVCTFTVAVNRRNDKEKVDFFRVQAWNGLADICSRYLAKGRKVAVTGSASLNTYTTNNGENRAEIVVNADDVEFLSPKQESPSAAPQTPQNAPQVQQGFVKVDPGDELPF